MQEKNNVLYVRFFGTFSVRWNGIQLINGRDSQFSQLLQILLHTRENGADRELLIDELFHDREIMDANHSMRVVLYNFKRRLREMGLPECAYIVKRNGRFYWTAEIPVVEDTVEFEAAYQKAAQGSTPEEKLNAYLTACELYGGDFLPMRAGSLWASREAWRYRDMFSDCVNGAAAILLEMKQYDRLQVLGKHAARVQPFSDWEHITLEALVGLGRYTEADSLYHETEQQYFDELRVQPDARLLELREIITAGKNSGQKTLEAIQEHLNGTHEAEEGAYLCSYAVFESIYRVMSRLKERCGISCLLLLCTLEEADGFVEADDSLEADGSLKADGTLASDGILNEKNALQEMLAQRFENAVCGSLRKTDIVCRCGKFQYLALLMNAAQDSCAAIQARIDAQFDLQESNYVIRYCTGAPAQAVSSSGSVCL
ncbi:MAG: bacterial transcriptional activator domain-containing protein [Eubacterium sp.]|nr:bacterial transcriptional activator domain-containing protein [Eubacterium sp.]